MTNNWGWENSKKKLDKRKFIYKIWKGAVFFILGVLLLSFFSFTNKLVYADNKTFKENLEKFSMSQYIDFSFMNFIYQLKTKENLLTEKNLILFDKYFDAIISFFGFGGYKNQIRQIYDDFRPYAKDIFKILGKEKTYLIVFENSSEERPFEGFMGSFAKLKVSSGKIQDLKFYDSYFVLYTLCKRYSQVSTGANPFKNCNKSIWSLENKDKFTKKLFPRTTFINANIFGFTKQNGENILNHYEKAFGTRPDGVIFVKSDILKYLFVDGEKLIWDMELMNYKQLLARKKGEIFFGVKKKYISKLTKLLSNKKKIIKNFILNYEKIKKESLIHIYIPGISKEFENFLKDNNFIIYNDKKSAYLLFYNLGNNKNSKFIDHIIKVNDKVYINKYKFSLMRGKNFILIKNILSVPDKYYKYLKLNGISIKSYLWPKSTIGIKDLLILPSNCIQESKENNLYIVNCN